MQYQDVILSELEGITPRVVVIAADLKGINKGLWAVVNLESNTVAYEVTLGGKKINSVNTIEEALLEYNNVGM